VKKELDFSKAVKNPFAERIKEHGYTTRVFHSPEYVADRIKQREAIIEAAGGRDAWLAKVYEEADDEAVEDEVV